MNLNDSIIHIRHIIENIKNSNTNYYDYCKLHNYTNYELDVIYTNILNIDYIEFNCDHHYQDSSIILIDNNEGLLITEDYIFYIYDFNNFIKITNNNYDITYKYLISNNYIKIIGNVKILDDSILYILDSNFIENNFSIKLKSFIFKIISRINALVYTTSNLDIVINNINDEDEFDKFRVFNEIFKVLENLELKIKNKINEEKSSGKSQNSSRQIEKNIIDKEEFPF